MSDLNRRQFLGSGFAAAQMGTPLTRPVRVGFIGIGSRGTSLLRTALKFPVEVPAVCDINETALSRAAGMVEAAGKRPETYGRGVEDWKRLLARTDQPALGTQPIHHHHDIQFGPCGLGGVQRVKHLLARFVLLQVQRDEVDAVLGLGDLLQQAAAKLGSAGQHLNRVGGQGETAQLGQQGTFE